MLTIYPACDTAADQDYITFISGSYSLPKCPNQRIAFTHLLIGLS